MYRYFLNCSTISRGPKNKGGGDMVEFCSPPVLTLVEI